VTKPVPVHLFHLTPELELDALERATHLLNGLRDNGRPSPMLLIIASQLIGMYAHIKGLNVSDVIPFVLNMATEYETMAKAPPRDVKA
jgi:hypothetical protein